MESGDPCVQATQDPPLPTVYQNQLKIRLPFKKLTERFHSKNISLRLHVPAVPSSGHGWNMISTLSRDRTLPERRPLNAMCRPGTEIIMPPGP